MADTSREREREHAGHAVMAADLRHLESRPDADLWRSAWRAKERWYGRWEEAMWPVFQDFDLAAADSLDAAIRETVSLTGAALTGAVLKVGPSNARLRALIARIVQTLRARMRTGLSAGRRGAVAVYTTLGTDTGEDAGQSALDALGLNRTFAWASQRDFVRDQLAVRGSKIIQLLYGSHLERLATAVVRATSPREPMTIDQVRSEILAEWDQISRADAQRIARTETGIVWERTNWYAMRANGVEQVRWLTAHGPAIGVTVGAVCLRCVALAKGSPYRMDELDEIPPAHPNCRCTLIPVLDARWLPPAQPWTGSEAPLPAEGLASEAGRIVPKDVQVFKAGRRWGNEGSGWLGPNTGWRG